MNRFLTLFIGIALSPFIASSEILTIGECYKLAHENYPMIKQFNLIKESEQYNIENATTGYLPQFSLSANAAYLSDSPEIMGTSPLPQEQYRVQIGVKQVIWDGGNISSKRRLIKAQAKMELENNNVILYELNDRVNRLFFGILLQNESLNQNKIHQKDIRDAIASVEAMIANGVSSQYDLNLLKVELLKAKQKETELRSLCTAYKNMLSFLIGRHGDEKMTLERPPDIDELKKEISRPEMDYFSSKEEYFYAERESIDAGLMPKISLFGYGGYGQSSFASLSDEKLYGLGGIAFSWSFGNYYTERNERLDILAKEKMVRAESESFIFNTRLKMLQEDAEIKKMSELLVQDKEIVCLRENIKEIAFARMKNGTISVTDFIRELNAKELARQNMILHSLEKLAREYNFKYLTNN